MDVDGGWNSNGCEVEWRAAIGRRDQPSSSPCTLSSQLGYQTETRRRPDGDQTEIRREIRRRSDGDQTGDQTEIRREIRRRSAPPTPTRDPKPLLGRMMFHSSRPNTEPRTPNPEPRAARIPNPEPRLDPSSPHRRSISPQYIARVPNKHALPPASHPTSHTSARDAGSAASERAEREEWLRTSKAGRVTQSV